MILVLLIEDPLTCKLFFKFSLGSLLSVTNICNALVEVLERFS